MRAILVAVVLALSAAAPSAQACVIASAQNPADVQHAEVVVVGYLSHYEVVRDQEARERRRRQIQDPDLSPELRNILRRSDGYMSDYARFRITVRETLRGEAPRTLTVTWNNSTYGEPSTMESGQYLVALNSDGRGGFRLLQRPCSPAFLFRASSAEARDIRQRVAR